MSGAHDDGVKSCLDSCGSPQRLFRQRNVLDTLRLYLELNDDLISQLQDKQLLTDDDVEVLQSLPWPSNRNELLQMLVRTRWTESSFSEFCDVLRQTQSSNLNRFLVDRLVDATVELSEQHHEHISQPSWRPSTAPATSSHVNLSDDYGVVTGVNNPVDGSTKSLDALLEPLSKSDRCTVRVLLREREQRIAQLLGQREQLKDDLLKKNNQLEDYRLKMMLSDRQLNEWLDSLPISTSSSVNTADDSDNDDSGTSLQRALLSVASAIDQMRERVAEMNAENDELRTQQLVSERRAADELAVLRDQLERATSDFDAEKSENERLNMELAATREELHNHIQNNEPDDQLSQSSVKFDDCNNNGETYSSDYKRQSVKLTSDQTTKSKHKSAVTRQRKYSGDARPGNDVNNPRTRRLSVTGVSGMKNEPVSVSATGHSTNGSRRDTRRASMPIAVLPSVVSLRQK